MIVAAMLASPFLLDYDLVIVAAPLAWMLREGAAKGFLSWEKALLLAAFVMPAVSRTIATDAKLPLAPFVLAALFVAILRRGASGQRRGAVVTAMAQAAEADIRPGQGLA